MVLWVDQAAVVDGGHDGAAEAESVRVPWAGAPVIGGGHYGAADAIFVMVLHVNGAAVMDGGHDGAADT
eukprot:940227-Rhodomonas_salina.2